MYRTARIGEFYFVGKVTHEENSAAAGLFNILGISRVGQGIEVESIALVVYEESNGFLAGFKFYVYLLAGILFVPVLYCIVHRFSNCHKDISIVVLRYVVGRTNVVDQLFYDYDIPGCRWKRYLLFPDHFLYGGHITQHR